MGRDQPLPPLDSEFDRFLDRCARAFNQYTHRASESSRRLGFGRASLTYRRRSIGNGSARVYVQTPWTANPQSPQPTRSIVRTRTQLTTPPHYTEQAADALIDPSSDRFIDPPSNVPTPPSEHMRYQDLGQQEEPAAAPAPHAGPAAAHRHHQDDEDGACLIERLGFGGWIRSLNRRSTFPFPSRSHPAVGPVPGQARLVAARRSEARPPAVRYRGTGRHR